MPPFTDTTTNEDVSLRQPKLAVYIYIIAIVIYCIKYVVQNVVVVDNFLSSTDKSNIVLLTIAMISFKAIFLTKYSRKQLIVCISLGIIGILTWIMSTNNDLVALFVLIIGACGIDYNRILKTVLYTVSAILMLTVLLYCLDFLSGFDLTRGETVRLALGFKHPNHIGLYMVLAFMSTLLMTEDDVKPEYLLAWCAITLGVLVITDSRTSALIMFSGLALIFASRFVPTKVLAGILAAISIVLILFGFLAPLLYSPHSLTMAALDKLLSKRLAFARSFITDYATTPFGQKLNLLSQYKAMQTGKTAKILDMSYMRIFLQYGVFGTIAYISIAVMTFIKGVRNNKISVCIAVFLLALSGVSESWIYNLMGAIVFSYWFATTPEDGSPGETKGIHGRHAGDTSGTGMFGGLFSSLGSRRSREGESDFLEVSPENDMGIRQIAPNQATQFNQAVLTNQAGQFNQPVQQNQPGFSPNFQAQQNPAQMQIRPGQIAGNPRAVRQASSSQNPNTNHNPQQGQSLRPDQTQMMPNNPRGKRPKQKRQAHNVPTEYRFNKRQ